ncbi:hypothetical protein BN7_6669 [Wickerhamomyces ciferrii]|uniref:Uncharacterized protein n=1 Tax=Wickerhamomyces ciferrii (strain ATCC 14091 / BCRC 22168 / CBS 111 / JCM 3599 / NBRC 0793 / NRRL Y-1031 F-60-10) TaxID=1206466 RepID=K0KP53_WICCF|nr:uncharacterized protein BN7_6669 [Wickerhamomyces ciferrii]CCH47060.1 hypothetical protein BN7_6669 [Wickerhamomyces ciferrii]
MTHFIRDLGKIERFFHALNQFVFDWGGDLSFESLLLKINQERFEKYGVEEQLFRLILTGDYSVIIMDHSIFDGGSVINLANELFIDDFKPNEINSIQEPIYKYDSGHTVSKPLERLIDFQAFKQGERLESELIKFQTSIKNYGSNHHFIVKTTQIPNLSNSLTSNIQKQWVQASINTFPNKFPIGLKYGTCFGVDGRPFLPTDDDIRYGCYSPGYFQNIDPKIDTKLYSDELRNEAKSGGVWQPFLSMFESDEKVNWVERFGNGLNNNIERDFFGITNIGKLKINGWFTQSTFNLEFAFGVVVMRFNNELRLIFTMVDNDFIKIDEWELIIEEFLRILK